MRYEQATELLLSGVPLTGTAKRAAMRNRETHYVSSNTRGDGRLKLARKIRRLPITKLFQRNRRAAHAIAAIERVAMPIPALGAKLAMLIAYRQIVSLEIQRRLTPKCNANTIR